MMMPDVSLRSLLDTYAEPAVLLSPDYEIIAANAAYAQWYGGEVNVVGETCYSVSHGYRLPCDQEGESCPLKSARETKRRQRVLHLHDTCHGKEHVDVEIQPILNPEGDVVCYLEKMQLVRSAKASPDGDGMVGRSAAFNTMIGFIERVAPSEVSVLLQGESGTGKELVAQAIHRASPRSAQAFVTVECSGLTESLFESELFGHEKGAFTGAVARKTGLVEAARGGTLFLDEVGDIPQALQVKLLRLLETGTYRRVGGVEPQHADFRLICASHKSLKKLVETGAFRQDLYYRIAVFPIALPRLAERSDDIPLLVQTFLRRIKGGERKKLSKEAQSCLSHYAFPGNIRELRNILERAVLLTDDDIIDLQHLPDECRNTPVLPAMLKEDEAGNGVITPLKDLEKTYLLQLSQAFQGDKKSLAAALGVSERTLYRKLQSL